MSRAWVLSIAMVLKGEAQRLLLPTTPAPSPEACPSFLPLPPPSPGDISHSRLVPGRRGWPLPFLAKWFMEIKRGDWSLFTAPPWAISRGSLERSWADFLRPWEEERFLSLLKVGRAFDHDVDHDFIAHWRKLLWSDYR